MCRCSLGVLSVVGRWNKARYKRSKRDGNLNKKHFLVIWSSLVHPRFVFGSSLVFYTVLKYKVQGRGILRKVLFALSAGVSLCDAVSPKGEVMASELR